LQTEEEAKITVKDDVRPNETLTSMGLFTPVCLRDFGEL
jgi:hypothetical protein